MASRANRSQMTPEEVARSKPRLINPGSKKVSTERSITVETDKGFMNIPTIVEGKQLSSKAAVESAKKSRIQFERFETIEKAVSAAKKRSEDIGRAIKKGD